VNYGTDLDPGQTWHIIEGDPLVIGVGSKGAMAVWVCQPNGITMQYFAEACWGTNVWLNGTSTADHYHSDYYWGGAPLTEVSHSKNGSWEVETVFGLGTDAELRQVITYTNGDYYYKRHWELTNASGGTLSDLRFFHGGDTYFGGDDSARSWWNPTQNMIYVNNSNFSNCGVMGFYGAPATPADHYFGGGFWTGTEQAGMTGRLDDTADANYVDAGYQLEWDRATLANGDTWVIEAYEVWTDPTAVQVLAPADQLTVADATVAIEFTLHNLDASSRTFDLSAVSDLGWAVTLTDGASD
ncbi:MAG: hypothetical protein GY851_06355, partial [bacterium]|nr:hypothetical protein [bacterium]